MIARARERLRTKRWPEANERNHARHEEHPEPRRRHDPEANAHTLCGESQCPFEVAVHASPKPRRGRSGALVLVRNTEKRNRCRAPARSAFLPSNEGFQLVTRARNGTLLDLRMEVPG